jgi:hypothetical protein
VLAVISNPANSATLRSTQLYAPYGSRLFQDQSMSAYTTKGFTGPRDTQRDESKQTKRGATTSS